MLLHRYIVDRVVNKPSQDYSDWALEEAMEFYIDDAILLPDDIRGQFTVSLLKEKFLADLNTYKSFPLF